MGAQRRVRERADDALVRLSFLPFTQTKLATRMRLHVRVLECALFAATCAHIGRVQVLECAIYGATCVAKLERTAWRCAWRMVLDDQ